MDPTNPKFSPRKHTCLGRLRHENIVLRVQKFLILQEFSVITGYFSTTSW
ncbi:alkaline phosphatase PhoX [Nostoc sp.]